MLKDIEKLIEQYFIDKGYKIRSIGIIGSNATDEQIQNGGVIDITPYLQIRVMKKKQLCN